MQVRGKIWWLLRQTMADSVRAVDGDLALQAATRELTLSASEPGSGARPSTQRTRSVAGHGWQDESADQCRPDQPKEFSEVTSTTDIAQTLTAGHRRDARALVEARDGTSAHVPCGIQVVRGRRLDGP